MPEGPEVHRMTVKLDHTFRNSIIYNIVILSGKYTSKEPYGYNIQWANNINPMNMKINSINNKGKFIWMDISDKDNQLSIWITLGLSGELSNEPGDSGRIKFITSKGIFYINDPLNFGTIHFMSDPNELKRKLSTLGPDPLQEQITYDIFTARLDRLKQNMIIADALLDQSLISGVGNYIRAEALYDAGVSPFIPVGNLDKEKRRQLLASIKKVMKMFYDHPNTEYRVYRRLSTPDGKEVLKSKTAKDRTIYYASSPDVGINSY